MDAVRAGAGYGRPGLLATAAFVALAALAGTARSAEPTEEEMAAWMQTLDPKPEGAWERIGWGPGVVSYASYRGAQRDGAVATVWIRWEYLQSLSETPQQWKSDARRVQYDCVRAASRELSITVYSENNLKGNPYSRTATTEQPWDPIIPGTMGDTVLKAVCARTKPDPTKAKTAN